MAYNALYRKYRPSRFSEVIGQEHITDVLLNQVRTGRIAHAYLFSGTRGTGKTSTARIFARAINCLDPQDGEPCGKCEACRINLAESIDIVEMDAASNSRVDEMRALLDKAEFAPAYRCYLRPSAAGWIAIAKGEQTDYLGLQATYLRPPNAQKNRKLLEAMKHE